ncbi:MAG: hypothetical protein OHK0022_38950 [Roseiflexaceae bacterium]
MKLEVGSLVMILHTKDDDLYQRQAIVVEPDWYQDEQEITVALLNSGHRLGDTHYRLRVRDVLLLSGAPPELRQQSESAYVLRIDDQDESLSSVDWGPGIEAVVLELTDDQANELRAAQRLHYYPLDSESYKFWIRWFNRRNGVVTLLLEPTDL